MRSETVRRRSKMDLAINAPDACVTVGIFAAIGAHAKRIGPGVEASISALVGCAATADRLPSASPRGISIQGPQCSSGPGTV